MSSIRVVRSQDWETQLHPGTYVIGRDASCRLRVSHDSVSRRHATLLVATDVMTIEDLVSRNGVFVNGKKISGPHKVVPGDVVLIGSAELVFAEESGARVKFTSRTLRNLAPVARAGNSPPPTAENRSAPPAAHSSAPPEDDTMHLRAPEVRTGPSPFFTRIEQTIQAKRYADAAASLSARWAVLATLRGTEPEAAEMLGEAARAALSLAAASVDATWIDRVLESYGDRRMLMPVAVIEPLGVAFKAVGYKNASAVQRYRAVVEASSSRDSADDAYAMLRLYAAFRRVPGG